MSETLKRVKYEMWAARFGRELLLCEAGPNADPGIISADYDAAAPAGAPADGRRQRSAGNRPSNDYLLCGAGRSGRSLRQVGLAERRYDQAPLHCLEPAQQNSTPCSFKVGTKGSWLAWRRAHLPLHDAWISGDPGLYQELKAQEIARDELFRERFVYCIFCRALMVYSAVGHFYCPYQWLGVHEHARRALR